MPKGTNPNSLKNLKLFQKGNKFGGSKKGSIHMGTILKKVLKEKVTYTNKNGQKITKRKAEWLADNVLMKGIKEGRQSVLEMVCDRIDGKVSQPLEVDSNVSIERDIPTDELFGELRRITEAVRARKSSDNKQTD